MSFETLILPSLIKVNSRHGMEGAFGIGGGGIITPESEESLNLARDLCRRGKTTEALPHLAKALVDPNNIDVLIELAFICPDPEQAIETIETAEIRGKAMLKRILGKRCFDNGSPQVGEFWDILETRPYMRVLQAMERIYFESKNYAKAIRALEEMLRLRPGDNMSGRKTLGSLLLREGRYADALSFSQAWLRPGRKVTPARGGTLYPKPSPKVYNTAEEIKVQQWTKCACEMFHTAAFASFKLFGDCPQSKQLLRLAAKSNPHILLKILGRKSRPQKVNDAPRQANGPEDAHDYLWYAQDLWMEEDIWNWANGNKEAKEFVLKNCSRDGCSVRETEVAQFKRCGACHRTSYCGPECQRLHWKNHKQACKDHQVLKTMTRDFNTGRPVEANAPALIAPDFNTSHGIVFTSPIRKLE